jgi:hypothetical protein
VNHVEHCSLLHAEDEDASAYLFRAALDEAGIVVSVYRVSDGQRALAFPLPVGAGGHGGDDSYHFSALPDLNAFGVSEFPGTGLAEQSRSELAKSRK